MSETPVSDEHLRVPRRTTPTWEIELLLSGALVFSLFSLREPLEDYFIRTMPVVTDLLQPLVVYSYLYGKLVLFVLLITFVLHLIARARWVALVGVHSIYPQGPNWDNFSSGPLAKRLTRNDSGTVEDAIERADNLSSLVFGYGILAAQLSMMILLLSLVLFGVVALLRAAGMLGAFEVWVLLGFALLLVLPMTLDKYLIARIGEDNWFARLTDRLLRWTFMLSLSRLQQPLNSLLTTNFGGKRGAWVLVGVLYSVLGLVTLDTFIRLDGMQVLRGKALAETERDFGLLPSHYAHYRTGSMRYSSAPFIDSEIVEGPYLRLTIPYLAQRHDAVIAKSCPLADVEDGLEAEPEREALRQAQRDQVTCFGRLFRIQLNGATQPALEFHRLQGLDDAPDGVVTLIDVRGLRDGRHQLRLEHVQKEEPEGAEAPPPRPHLIDFWR